MLELPQLSFVINPISVQGARASEAYMEDDNWEKCARQGSHVRINNHHLPRNLIGNLIPQLPTFENPVENTPSLFFLVSDNCPAFINSVNIVFSLTHPGLFCVPDQAARGRWSRV